VELTVEYAIKSLNLRQSSNANDIEAVIEQVITNAPEKVTAYKKGRKGLLGFFVGSVMKEMRTADPAIVNKLLIEKLKE